MKTISLLLVIFAFLTVVSCKNDTTPQAEKIIDVVENEVVIVPSTMDSSVIIAEVPKDDKEEEEVQTKTDKVSSTASTQTKLTKKQITEVISEEEAIKTAEDLSGELNNEVNRKANPDNYNGVKEIDTIVNVMLVPVYSEPDLNKYFVQVAVKVHKMSRVELGKIFPSNEAVYILQHEGLYKYCLGKFDTENEAANYKKDIDKKYKFKDTQVVTFQQAW